MSKLVTFFLFSILIETAAGAVEKNRLSCSLHGTRIFFINGIHVKNEGVAERQYRDFLDSLDSHKVDQKGVVESRFLYNRSENVLLDAYKTYKHSLEKSKISSETIVKIFLNLISNNLNRFKLVCGIHQSEEKCKSILGVFNDGQTSLGEIDLRLMIARVLQAAKQGKKLIFVTHSGGAVFADGIRRHLRDFYPEYYKFSSHFSMARPFVSNLNKTFNATFDRDEASAVLRFIFPNRSPATNLTMYQACDGGIADFSNHYQSCYFNGEKHVLASEPALFDGSLPISSINYMKDSVYRVATYLPSNDERCCPGVPGKSWRNEIRCQLGQPHCVSGFMADSVEYSNPRNIELVDSYVCTPYKIHPGNNKVTIHNSYLNGEGVISKGFITDSRLEPDSVTHFSGLGVQSSTLHGSNTITENAVVAESQLSGNNVITNEIDIWRTTLSTNQESPSTFQGSMKISESILEGVFNINSHSRITLSNLKGYVQLDGNTHLHKVNSEGTLIGSSYLPNSLYLEDVTNAGELYLENHISIKRVSFFGKNTMKNNVRADGGTIFTGENFVSGNMFFPDFVQIINNLHAINETPQKSFFKLVSWGGTLTLNGSVNIQVATLGENVTISSFRGPYQDQYNLEFWSSTAQSGANIYETGTFQNCDFFADGTNNCNKLQVGIEPIDTVPEF